MRATRLWTSFGSDVASFLRLLTDCKLTIMAMTLVEETTLTIYSDIAQGGSAVVLDIGVGRIEQRDKYGYRACIDELLPVLVYVVR